MSDVARRSDHPLAACFEPTQSSLSEPTSTLVPQPPPLYTPSDGGTTRSPSVEASLAAHGHYAEENFEVELPFHGLGLGLKGSKDGIGRDTPLGKMQFRPGNPDALDPAKDRGDARPDLPKLYRRSDDPRKNEYPPDKAKSQLALPDGGTVDRR